MDKADLAQPTDLEAVPQNDATRVATHPTFLDRTHQCVSGMSRIAIYHTDDCLGSSKGLIIPIDPPPTPKGSIEDADYIPEMTAGWFSLLTFSWMNSLMTLGYARPLEASDLWKLQDHRSAGVIAETILSSFDARRKRRPTSINTRLANGEIKPPAAFARSCRGCVVMGEERLKRWKEKDGKAQPSLTWAMNDAVKWWFWSSGVLKVIGDTAQITSPLILKVG